MVSIRGYRHGRFQTVNSSEENHDYQLSTNSLGRIYAVFVILVSDGALRISPNKRKPTATHIYSYLPKKTNRYTVER